jgi:hypothetical protein
VSELFNELVTALAQMNPVDRMLYSVPFIAVLDVTIRHGISQGRSQRTRTI